jgi:hypothetical protein
MKDSSLLERENLMKLQKLGGYASVVMICALIVGGIIEALTLPGLGLTGAGGSDPLKVMAAYDTSPTVFRVLQPINILLPIYMVLIALVLQERMRAGAPYLMRLAVIAASIASALLLAEILASTPGLISISSTKDISAYRAFRATIDGLASAGVNAWGWAALLIGCAAIRTRALPRILRYIILLNGVATIITFAVAQAYVVGLLLFLISVVWLGVALLRKPEPIAAQT